MPDSILGERSDLTPFVAVWINGAELDTVEHLDGFTFQHTLGGGASGTLSMVDDNWEHWETWFVDTGVDTDIKFKFGYVGGDETGMIKAKATKVTPEFTEGGITLEVEFTGEYTYRTYETFSKIFDIEEFPLISDIARWVIKEQMGFTDFIVDPTEGTRSESITVKDENPVDFMRKELAKRAINYKGDGDYIFDVGCEGYGDTQPKFISKHSISRKVYKTYFLMKDKFGEMKSFTPSDNSRLMAAFGGDATGNVSIDTKTKEPKTVKLGKTEGAEKLKKKANSSPIIIGGGRPIKTYASLPTVGAEADIQQEALARYARFRDLAITGDAELIGDPKFPPGGYIEIIVQSPKGKLHWFSGIYMVKSVTHTIGNGEYSSELEVMREANLYGPGEIAGTKVQLVKE